MDRKVLLSMVWACEGVSVWVEVCTISVDSAGLDKRLRVILKKRIDGKCSCLLGEPSKRIVGRKILRFSVKYDIIY